MAKKTTPAPKGPRKTVDSFRALHDRNVAIPNKIRAGIDQMRKDGGGEHWEYAIDFARIAGVSLADLNKFADQFTDFTVEAKAEAGSKRHARQVWFATKKAADDAKAP